MEHVQWALPLGSKRLKEEEITSSVTQGQHVMHSPDSSSPKLEHMCERDTEAQPEIGYSSSFCYVAMLTNIKSPIGRVQPNQCFKCWIHWAHMDRLEFGWEASQNMSLKTTRTRSTLLALQRNTDKVNEDFWQRCKALHSFWLRRRGMEMVDDRQYEWTGHLAVRLQMEA